MKNSFFLLKNIMFSKNFWLGVFLLGICLTTIDKAYGQNIKEKSTGIEFAKKLEIAGKKYEYVTSGSIEASFVFTFNVCAFAYYMEEGKFDKNKDLKQLFEDGPAKYLVVNFVRNVKAKDIRESYDDSFKKIITNYNTPKAKEFINPFLNAITDINKNEKMEFFWFEGGKLEFLIKGQKKYNVENQGIAKAIWAVYLQ